MVDQMNRWILVQSGFTGSILIYYDPSDLGSLILIRIISKERTLILSVPNLSLLQQVFNNIQMNGNESQPIKLCSATLY